MDEFVHLDGTARVHCTPEKPPSAPTRRKTAANARHDQKADEAPPKLALKSFCARSNLTIEASTDTPSTSTTPSYDKFSPDAVREDYMAGSRRSPLLRDQWRAAKDPEDRERDRDRGRAQDSARDKGRDRDRDSKPHRRHWENRSERRTRSPPPSRRGAPSDRDPPRSRRDLSPDTVTHRGRATSRDPLSREKHQKGSHHISPTSRRSPTSDHREAKRSRPLEESASGRHHERDDSPTSHPPSKRKRTRSPSSRAHRHHHHHHHHHHRSRHSPKRGDSRDQSHQPRSRRHLPDQNRSPRQSPVRDRERGRRSSVSRRDTLEAESQEHSRSRRSKSPVRRDHRRQRSPRRSRSPHIRDQGKREHHRSPSRQSFRSTRSRESASPGRGFRRNRIMNSTQPIQSVVDDSKRSPSPLRPIPSFDADNAGGPLDGESRIREAFPMHGMRASDVHGNQRGRPSRPHVDTRQYSTSPQYVTPTSSYHGSPSGSPYSNGRGGWSGQPSFHGQHGQIHGRSSPYRQNNYSQSGPQGQYYQNHQGQYNGPPSHMQQGYSGPPYRGGHSGYRGNYQNQGPDRRFSGSGPQSHGHMSSQRGRGHFSNLQWTASGSRGRGGQHSPHSTHTPSSQGGSLQPPSSDRRSPDIDEGDNPFRPSKDLQVEDQGSKQGSENGDAKKMPPPARQNSTSSTPAKEGGKFSFAFKSKAAPAPVPKPVPDLAQRMQARNPPPRAPEPSRNSLSAAPPPKSKHDTRFDRRDRERERDRDRDRGRDRDDRRDPRDFREPRDKRDIRDVRRDDRRHDYRDDRRRDDRRMDFRFDRRRERSPEKPKKQKKIALRQKPRPTVPQEFAHSESVYHRKPGNESVIGAGTYGKVFKAIHIYTENKVALKKIRMEGEKDGFPVTAVREIRLLQHLRNHNVVSLLEVMVEKNECFMVFEYLSHDLTGLINHPTFSLTAAHKKDLAKQMFEGLNYLHHRGVLHRDIKAANILISNTGLLKFADFGLARFFSKSRQLDYTNRVITIWYRPPELLLGETRYGPAIDVWSAACVYMEMFTRKAVFPGEGGEISQLDKLYNCLGTPTRADWPDIVEMPWFELMRPTERKTRVFEDLYREVLSPAALDLVAKMFQYDPSKRPTAEEVLAHPYFLSEEPGPQQAVELENIEGDWHEFESKALRKGKDKEARRAEYQKEKEKRKASASVSQVERDSKRMKQETGDSRPPSQAGER